MKTTVYREAAMSSLVYLRELMCQRLNAAAEEIFSVFEKIVADYEEEVNRQRRLLDIVCEPELQSQQIDLQQQHVYAEGEVVPTDLWLCNQERSFSLDQEEPQSLQIQEEQEGLYSSHEGEQPVLTQETDSFMLTLVNEESNHTDSDNWSLSDISYESPESTPRKRRRRKKYLSKSSSDTQRSLKCDTCGKSFAYPSQLTRHLTVHTGEKPFVCTKCGRGWSTNYRLKEHMLTHRDKEERSSSLVQEEPQSLQIIEEQEGIDISQKQDTVRDHTEPEPDSNVKPLSDSAPVAESQDQTGSQHVANKLAETQPQKRRHTQKKLSKSESDTYTEEKSIICGTCGKSFKYLCHLKSHQRVHTGEKPFECKLCNKALSTKYVLATHMLTHRADKHHPGNHYLSQTHNGKRCFKCDKCGKSFMYWSRLKTHLRAHTGEKPFVCQMCRKGFKHKHELTKHMLSHRDKKTGNSYLSKTKSDTHTGEKPFKCHNCGKSYGSACHLSLLQGKYAKTKKYACKPCFDYFKCREESKSHNAGTDSGVEPNVCKVCGKKVATEAGLMVHMRRHTREKP